MDEWQECEVSGHMVNGDYSIWEQGTGIWYLDKLEFYIGYIPVAQFRSEEAAMAAVELMEVMQ